MEQFNSSTHFVARKVTAQLADEDAKVLEAYDLPHVKKNQSERKHVTFLKETAQFKDVTKS